MKTWRSAGLGGLRRIVAEKAGSETGELENTLIVVSGNHGMPGVTNGKCNPYDFGTSVALAARLPKGMGARRGSAVDGLISLPNLAPTFFEASV